MQGQLPKSSLKSGRRSVHPNFVEVVDVLVDRVMSYKNASIPGEHDTKGKSIVFFVLASLN